MKFQFLYTTDWSDRDELLKQLTTKIYDSLCKESEAGPRVEPETRNSKKDVLKEDYTEMEEKLDEDFQLEDDFLNEDDTEMEEKLDEDFQLEDDFLNEKDSEMEDKLEIRGDSLTDEGLVMDEMLKKLDLLQKKMKEEIKNIEKQHPQENVWLSMSKDEQTKTALNAVDQTFVLQLESIIEV
jgi:hypothetical protein